MTMSDERMDAMLDDVRGSYHVPPETPVEAMWTAIESRVGSPAASDDDVIDIDTARRIRKGPSHRMMGWSVAAAAVLVMGIGIGRMTAPVVPTTPTFAASTPSEGTMALAARDHLGRTESLLTMVLADARAGRVDPETSVWARGLLAQTRLLIDNERELAPSVDALLLDLELVLVQIVGVSETGSMDEAMARTELELALRSLEDGEVLTRIQAALPSDMAGA